MFPIYPMVRGKPRGTKVDVVVRSSSFSSSLTGPSRDIDIGDLTGEPLAALEVYNSIAIVTSIQLRLANTPNGCAFALRELLGRQRPLNLAK